MLPAKLPIDVYKRQAFASVSAMTADGVNAVVLVDKMCIRDRRTCVHPSTSTKMDVGNAAMLVCSWRRPRAMRSTVSSTR